MGGTCAACKKRKQRCEEKDCFFAPYFPSADPQKFDDLRKVFGASKFRELLQGVPVKRRADAMRSLLYEANARVKDPVNGCAEVVCLLQSQVSVLEAARGLYDMSQAPTACIQNHGAVKGGKSKEAFETASGVAAGEAAESSDAAVKHRRLTFDLNEPPSGEDERIMC